MKKSLQAFKLGCISVFVLLMSEKAFGQNVATIGTGTTSTTSTGNDPIDGYYESFRYQVVYTAAELTAAGIPANATITALGFSIAGDYGGGNLLGYKIFMGHTNAANSAAHDNSPTSLVKSSFSYNPTVTVAGAFDLINFNSNFVWNGTSNILVDICSDGPNPYTSPYGSVRTIASFTTNGSRFVRADGSGSQCGVNTGSTNSNKPQIQFIWTAPPPCSGTPNTATITGVNSACSGVNFNLGLTGASAGDGISYQWESSIDGGATWTPVVFETSTSLTTNATATTQYQLVTTCANGGATSTSAPYTVNITAFSGCTCLSYPAIYANAAFDTEISNVTVGSMNNTSNCVTAATGPGSILSRYGNYSGIVPGHAAQTGDVVPFSLTQTSCGGNYSNFFQIYLDWNQDGDFLDLGEQVYSQATSVTGNNVATGSFTVPASALQGITRMRVVNIESSAAITNYAHTPYSYGETEDYCFSITVPCAGTPATPIAALTGTTPICFGLTTAMSASGISAESGIVNQWTYATTPGGPYTNFVGASNLAYTTLTTLIPNTYYAVFNSTCTFTNQTASSNEITFTVDVPPTITVTPNSAPYCQPGGTAVAMTASGGLTYEWAPATGLSATSGTSVTASPSATTIYTVTGTGVNGCNSVATATISLASSVTLSNTGATPASVCSGGNSVLATTGVTANASYCQPTANCNFGDMITDVTFSTINNTTACSGGFILYPAFNPTVNAGASIPLSVSTSLQYPQGVAVWIDFNTNGTFEASELVLDGYLGTTNATYTGTVQIPANATNGTTRMRVRSLYVQNPNAIGPCANASYGETEDYLITIVGGLDPISYAWTPNTNLGSVIGDSVTASNVLTPETYTVTATSSAGCTATATATINVFALPTVSAGLDQSICTGSPATLSGSGAVTYTWDNGVTNNVAFNPTSNTTYTVTGVDTNGCSNVDDMNITMLALPLVNAGIDQAICINASTSVTASGAVTYTWNNNVVDSVSFSPTGTASYTVTGIGVNGCSNQDSLTIVVNPLPLVNAGPNYTVCEEQNITLTANTNGTTVAWNNGITNGFPFTPNLGSATYIVTATSGAGCVNIDSTIVSVNPLPTVTIGANQIGCVGSPVVFTANATSSPSGSWTTNGQGTIAPNVTNNSVTYTPTANEIGGTVLISFAAFNSCGIASDTASIVINGTPTVSAGMDMTICSGESILLSGTGATTYTWNNGAVDNVTFVPTISGIYTVVGADTNGCTDTDDVLVTINQTPNATSTAIDPVTLVATPSGENYQWIDCATGLSIADATSDTLIALVNGEYAVVVSSSNGCSDTSSCITVDQVGLYIPTSLVISVYPNPTFGNVSISLPSNDQGVLSIYDAQGKLVQTTNSLKNGDVINLSTYTPGMYTFKIAFGEMIHIERVIKN
jgi:hypothetical protein